MGRGMGVEGLVNYEMEAEEWTSFVLEKLKEFLAVVTHFGKIFMAKVDEVFPPETRVEQLKHWAKVATPYILVAVAFWILLRCFCGFCCCIGQGVGSAVKMMIAPGTHGALRIARATFEASPKLYFRGLRGG